MATIVRTANLSLRPRWWCGYYDVAGEVSSDGLLTVDIQSGGILYQTFDNITISNGSSITNVDMQMYAGDLSKGDDLIGTYYGCDVGNPAPVFSTTAGGTYAANVLDATRRPRTTANVSISQTVGTVGYVSSPNLDTEVKEIIDRRDWKYGNALGIIFVGTAGCDFYTTLANSTILTIDYTARDDSQLATAEVILQTDCFSTYRYSIPNGTWDDKNNKISLSGAFKTGTPFFNVGQISFSNQYKRKYRGMGVFGAALTASTAPTTPDVAALDITGDFGIIACISGNETFMRSISGNKYILSKIDVSSISGGYALYISQTGFLTLNHYDGGTVKSHTSSVSIFDTSQWQDDRPLWIAAGRDVDNGSSQFETAFYIGVEIRSGAIVWSLLGSNQTTSGTYTATANAIALSVMSTKEGSIYSGAETFQLNHVMLYNAINGSQTPIVTTGTLTKNLAGDSLVAEFSPNFMEGSETGSASASYTDITGKSWTWTNPGAAEASCVSFIDRNCFVHIADSVFEGYAFSPTTGGYFDIADTDDVAVAIAFRDPRLKEQTGTRTFIAEKNNSSSTTGAGYCIIVGGTDVGRTILDATTIISAGVPSYSYGVPEALVLEMRDTATDQTQVHGIASSGTASTTERTACTPNDGLLSIGRDNSGNNRASHGWQFFGLAIFKGANAQKTDSQWQEVAKSLLDYPTNCPGIRWSIDNGRIIIHSQAGARAVL